MDPTGEMDNETVEKMNTPRCGVRDYVGPSVNARRRKRYALQVGVELYIITYYISLDSRQGLLIALLIFVFLGKPLECKKVILSHN